MNWYEWTPDSSLSDLRFVGICDEWLDFVARCRSGLSHSYDVVEGPMTDDTIWNFVNDYIAGNIPRAVFF